MRWLRLSIDPKLSVAVLQAEVGEFLEAEGCTFRRRMPARDIVFYDWIADRNGAIRALEIHLPMDDPCLKTATPLDQLPHVDVDGFARFWLLGAQDCTELGYEAFGDIFFFGAADGRLAIVVGLVDWLSDRQRNQLLSDLTGGAAR
jgi:hypothetical protein